MLRLLESPSNSERIEAARAFLSALSPATNALVIAASRGAADDIVRRVTLAAGATFGSYRASLPQLAAQLAAAELARRRGVPTSRLGSEALAARVAFEALESAALGYFATVARFPGFARVLASTLEELRLAGVPPGAMTKLGRAGEDIAELLSRLEAAREGAGLADRAALFGLAAAAIAGGVDLPILHAPMVLLDVPIASPAELTFVKALTARAPSVLAVIPTGDEETLRALLELGGQPEQPARAGRGLKASASSPAARAAALGHLRSYLFAEDAPESAAEPGEVVFFSAPGEGREAIEIARQILEEARVGTPFDEIAILVRSPRVYAAPLATVFARAGIPAFFAHGTQRPDPAGRALLALLDCALEKFSASRFAEYLSLGQVPPLGADGAPPSDRAAWVEAEDEVLGLSATAREPEPNRSQDSGPRQEGTDGTPVVEGTLRAPWRWEKLLVDSAVIGGRDRWSRRLAGLDAALHVRLEELREQDPDSPRIDGIERDLANLEHLRRFALPVIGRLAELPVQASWGDWIEALEELAPMVLRHPERVLAVVAELRPLAPIGPVALDEVRDVLAEALTTVAERPPSARYGRVFVGPVDQARGRAFEVVFLPGLAERMFPQKPREDPILLDELRRRLGAGLKTQGERAGHERFLLQLAVGAARRRLYVSYSRIEVAEARPRVPSFYALEVQRALTGHIPDPQTLEREAAAAAGARLAWPAPDDPARAIDELEHDLASLLGLLRHGGPDAKGRARYLLDLNACLARSLRSRWARWRRSWTPFDGLVRLSDGTSRLLLASRPSTRAYSTSALQQFSTCPYQFFLSAICRLAPREELGPLDRLDPPTRGRLFHEVQAECLRALHGAGRLPLTRETLDAAMVVLDETLTRVAEAYREQLAPAIARVWQDEVASIRIDLRTWLERSVEDQAAWEPFAFELAFGLPARPGVDPRSVTAEVVLAGGWRLRGIVDLVERRRGGSGLRVTDHKTGANRTTANMVVGKGETLQPVLYGLAVEQILGETVGESRLSFCTRVGGFSERVVPMSDSTRRRGLEVLDLIDRSIARGFLPPAPRDRACEFCDFRAVCGPLEERRLREKDVAALDDLRTLRSWP